MKTMLTTLLILLLSFVGNTLLANDALSDSLIDFDKASSYKSEDLYRLNKSLVEAYPELLEMEIIGYSYDQQPIYVIRLGNTLNHSNLYVNKMHGLIESGTHSREVANPVITSKILSDYVMDYYDDAYLNDIHIKELLEHSVLHFVINSNPDGYNIAKHGPLSVKTESAYNYLLSIEDTNYSNYKANIRGVDLNRNYPDSYYDTAKGKWIDKWSIKQNSYKSEKASGAYYAGDFPASEIETQTMMAYLLSYDFRYYLSFHSKGEVIYGNFTYLDSGSQAYISRYKTLASTITGYDIPPFYETQVSSGYMSDFIVNNTLKPAITVETLPSSVTLPLVTTTDLNKAYEDTYTLPYRFMQNALAEGYFDYLLYVDGRYQRDFQNKLYAEAIADKLNGTIIKREDPRPSLYLGNTVTREEFLTKLFKLRPFNFTLTSITQVFSDTQNPLIYIAKANGIVKGYDNHFYPKQSITYLEAAIILYRIESLTDTLQKGTVSEGYPIIDNTSIPLWATSEVLYSVSHGYMARDQAYNSLITREDFETILLKFTEQGHKANH